jgi:cytochrome c peroxidase
VDSDPPDAIDTDDTDLDDPTLDETLAAILAAQRDPVAPLDPLSDAPPALITLGEALFYDPILSGNKDVACATCHHPATNTSDGLPRSLGTGATGLGPDRAVGDHPEWVRRRAPHLWNRGRLASSFWDGRVEQTDDGVTHTLTLPPGGDDLGVLAVQALHPIVDVVEMLGEPGDQAVDGTTNELAGLSDREVWDALQARLRSIPAYVALFDAAFPEQAWGMAEAATALEAFQRDRFDPTDTPWDRYLRGDLEALPADAKLGAAFFFGGGRCSACHAGPLLSDQRFHNIGLPFVGVVDTGRQEISGSPDDAFAFRTAPLRNVSDGGPFMHNGALADLGEVLTHYADPARTSQDHAGAHLPDDLPLVGTPEQLQALRDTLSHDLPRPGGGASTVGLSNIRAFLGALTDAGELERAQQVPTSVPSGLKVGGG